MVDAAGELPGRTHDAASESAAVATVIWFRMEKS
jgi:hypothetical protein